MPAIDYRLSGEAEGTQLKKGQDGTSIASEKGKMYGERKVTDCTINDREGQIRETVGTVGLLQLYRSHGWWGAVAHEKMLAGAELTRQLRLAGSCGGLIKAELQQGGLLLTVDYESHA